MNRLILLLTFFLSAPAFAHHPLAGREMSTFLHGFLSGIGHPLLGFDHLFFIALVGVAAIYTGYSRLAPFSYVAAMIVGCVLMTMGVVLPAIEWMIGLSLLVLGSIVLAGRGLSMIAAIGLFAVAGLFHGAAFGESMASAEAASVYQVLIGYLLGLGLIQYGVALLTGRIAIGLWKATEASAIQVRLSGAIVAGVGIFLMLENIEGAVFSVLGLA